MKLKFIAAGLISFLWLVTAATADLLSAGVNLGAAGQTHRWALFTLGADENGYGVWIQGPPGGINQYSSADIVGNIAIAGAARGLGTDIFAEGYTHIDGDIYMNAAGDVITEARVDIDGTIYRGATTTTLLNKGITDARNASLAASQLKASTAFAGMTTIRANTSLSLTTTGNAVLRLSDFTLDKGATLTLSGPASSSFIFNITGTFAIEGGSQILLTGGLTASNVLFNVTGTGSTLQIQGDSLVYGTILAPNRAVELGGQQTKLNGSIIANNVLIGSGAQVSASY